MHWPHWNLDSERDHEAQEQPDLRTEFNRQLVPLENRETATGMNEQVHQGEQEQQGTEQGVEEELECGIHAIRAAPHTNDQVKRNQRGFEEHVEQNTIQRGEDTVHQTRHDQERGVVLGNLLLDNLPASHHHNDGDEGIEDDEQHRYAINTQVVVDIESVESRSSVRRIACRHWQLRNPSKAGSSRTKTTIAPIRASIRASGAFRSLPVVSTTRPRYDRNPDCER